MTKQFNESIYINKSIHTLNNFKELNESIKLLQNQIDYNRNKGLPTEDLECSINLTRIEIGNIYEILEVISQDPGCENYGQLLTMWHINKLDKYTICAKLHYSSKQTIYDLHKKAIRKFTIARYGQLALDELIHFTEIKTI